MPFFKKSLAGIKMAEFRSTVQQAHGLETLLNGGNKMVYNGDQHNDRNRGTSHAQSNAHQLAGGAQVPTTSANVATNFPNVLCNSQGC